MASIHRRGDRWRAMWRDHDGRQRSKSFDRKRDAELHLAQVQTDLARGHYIDPARGRTTLAAFVDQWAPAQHWRTTTRQTAESHLNRWILPALGARPLATITRTDVQRFVTELSAAGLEPGTVETIYRRLVSILEAAAADRIIGSSPAQRIALPKRARRRHDSVVVLDPAAVHRLAETVPDRMRAFVYVIAAAGLRPGEAAGLTVERVNLDRAELHVDRQLVTVIGDAPALAPPKTDASIRSVPIPRLLVDELSWHLDRFEPAELELGASLLFTNRDGRPWRRQTLGEAWGRYARRAALPPAAKGWHALRHTYASTLIHAGLSVRAVQSRLGHASATETLDTYSHLWPDSDDDTRRAVDAAFASK